MWEISVPALSWKAKRLVCYVPPKDSLVETFKALQKDDPCWSRKKPHIRKVDIQRDPVDLLDIALVEI